MSFDITALKSNAATLKSPPASAEAFAAAMRQPSEAAEPQSAASAEPALLAQRGNPLMNMLKKVGDFYNEFAPDAFVAGGTSTGLPGPSGGVFATLNRRTGDVGSFHALPIGKPIDLGFAKLGFSAVGTINKKPGDEGGVNDQGGVGMTLTVPGQMFLFANIRSSASTVTNFSKALATLAHDPNNQGAKELVKGEHVVPVTIGVAFNANSLATKTAGLISPKVSAGLDAAMKATNSNAWVGGAYNAGTMTLVDGIPTKITIRGKEHNIADMMKNFTQNQPNKPEFDRFGNLL